MFSISVTATVIVAVGIACKQPLVDDIPAEKNKCTHNYAFSNNLQYTYVISHAGHKGYTTHT